MSDPSPARGNFHVNPGLLSLPFSGILHNTQFSQFPHIIKLFIGNKISKIFEKVKQTNKYEDTNIPCPVMWRCQVWAEASASYTHWHIPYDNLYLQHSLGQVTGKPSQDKMWSRKERSRGHRVRAGEIFAELSKQKMSRQRPGPVRWGEARLTPTSDLGRAR